MKFLKSASNVTAIAAGWAVFALAIFVTAEVLSRKLFNFSFQSADEMGSYILAIASVAGFSVALVTRSHTRVDLVHTRLPVFAQAWLNVATYVALAFFAVFMAWHAGTTLLQSYQLGSRSFTPLRTPLWIPQGFWFLGLLMFAVVSLTLAILAVRRAFGDPAAAATEFGPLGTEDAIADEVPEEDYAIHNRGENR